MSKLHHIRSRLLRPRWYHFTYLGFAITGATILVAIITVDITRSHVRLSTFFGFAFLAGFAEFIYGFFRNVPILTFTESDFQFERGRYSLLGQKSAKIPYTSLKTVAPISTSALKLEWYEETGVNLPNVNSTTINGNENDIDNFINLIQSKGLVISAPGYSIDPQLEYSKLGILLVCLLGGFAGIIVLVILFATSN